MSSSDRVAARRGALVLAAALALALLSALAGCGFHLRQAPQLAFKTIQLGFVDSSALGNELKRSIAVGTDTQVVSDAKDAQVIMEVLVDQREKTVVALNASGQVREFQLRTRLKFRLRTPQGRELIPDTEIVLFRDVSFSESAVLAKESEEALLYRTMQSDIVAQVMRRLAAVRSL